MSLVASEISLSLDGISLSEKPVISFVDTINRISSKCFVKSQSLSGRRGIFDGGYATNKGTDFDYMGENFIFVNRVTECKKLITRFGEMDLLRG